MRVLAILGAAILGSALSISVANAAPMPGIGAIAGSVEASNLIVEVQNRRGGGVARPGAGAARGGVARGGGGGAIRGGGVARGGGFARGGGRGFARGGGRGFGAAAVGLGVLGAAVAIGAAQSAPRECWVEQQPVHDSWGNFRGYRNVRVCQRY